MGQFLSVAVAIGVPVAAGLGIGVTLQEDVKGWYKALKKPSWTPPDWAFGPVWTVLYSAMGYASYLVWKNSSNATLPLSLYGIQLVLNLAWSPLFFRKKEIGFALLDITALLGVLGATVIEFNKVSPTASYLLLPYLAWSTYATALTADIYKRNPEKRGKNSEKARKDAEDIASSAKKKASDLADSAADKAGELSDKVQGKSASDKAEDAAKDTKSAVKSAGKEAEGQAKKASDKVEGAAKGAANSN